MNEYDAVLVPGGGVQANGEVQPWVRNRLEAAVKVSSEYIITLSAGTTHKAPPLDLNQFPVFESTSGARYLVERGIEPKRLLSECCSYDTIGNAYFARVIHTDIRQLRKLLVITSEFHMPRTQAIFEWVFGLTPHAFKYDLSFFPVENVGLNETDLAARVAKEQMRLSELESNRSSIQSLQQLHAWLFLEHRAYGATQDWTSDPIDPAVLRTY